MVSRVIGVGIKLLDWLFNSINSEKMLSLSSDYFKIRKAIDRKIYETSKKSTHGAKNRIGIFLYTLKTLKEKIDSAGSLKELRRKIKILIKSDLPNISVFLYEKTDKIIFQKRLRSTKNFIRK